VPAAAAAAAPAVAGIVEAAPALETQPKRPLMILVGCQTNLPMPGYTLISAEQWLSAIDGYYTSSAFERRDRLRARILGSAEQFREQLAGVVLTVVSRDPDVDHLVSTLASLPGTVVISAPR
jgi:hypothetical protein